MSQAIHDTTDAETEKVQYIYNAKRGFMHRAMYASDGLNTRCHRPIESGGWRLLRTPDLAEAVEQCHPQRYCSRCFRNPDELQYATPDEIRDRYSDVPATWERDEDLRFLFRSQRQVVHIGRFVDGAAHGCQYVGKADKAMTPLSIANSRYLDETPGADTYRLPICEVCCGTLEDAPDFAGVEYEQTDDGMVYAVVDPDGYDWPTYKEGR